MELRDVKTFVIVAGLLNFNRAGQALHAAQSTVSARIQALEGELGVRLFDRLGRRVALTQAGERLLEYGRKLLDLESEARAWTAGETGAGGALAVRIPESLCVNRLPRVLGRFRERYPKVGLSFPTCSAEGLTREDLRKGLVDMAFLLADGVQALELRVECLGVEPLGLVAAPGHPLAARKAVSPGDLHGRTMLFTKSDCRYRRDFERMLAEEGVSPVADLEFASLEALKRCVAAGLGVSVMPLSAIRAEAAGGTLKILPWTGDALETAVLMVWHRDKWLSPALTAFMDLARRELMAD